MATPRTSLGERRPLASSAATSASRAASASSSSVLAISVSEAHSADSRDCSSASAASSASVWRSSACREDSAHGETIHTGMGTVEAANVGRRLRALRSPRLVRELHELRRLPRPLRVRHAERRRLRIGLVEGRGQLELT